MAFTFPKKNTYDTPEGEHRAIVREAFEMQDGQFRIVFEIISLTHPLLIHLAGKNYKPGKQTLPEDLHDWLGLEELQTIVRSDGTIDAAKLRGRLADIRIIHIQNDAHAKPYAYISKIKAPGELIDFQHAA